MKKQDEGRKPEAGGAAESVGVAVCKPDGTIEMMLRAKGPKGEIGEAMKVYKPADPKYAGIVAHLGGIKPGQSKPIPPFV